MSFKDKVVWVTGASSGIGEHLSYEFARSGAYLILSARNSKNLHRVQSLCKDPRRVKVLPLDLEKFNDLSDKATEAIELWGRVDVLINNGGISQRSLTVNTIIDVDDRLMKINYLGAVALTKALLPHWLEKNEGHVVTVTSMVGKFGTPMRSSYSATKHALHGFMDSMRAELPTSIKVQLVCPGFVKTNVSVNALIGDGSTQGTMDKATANGIPVETFALKMLKKIQTNGFEFYICGKKEMFGLYVIRFFPLIFHKLIRKFNVT